MPGRKTYTFTIDEICLMAAHCAKVDASKYKPEFGSVILKCKAALDDLDQGLELDLYIPRP